MFDDVTLTDVFLESTRGDVPGPDVWGDRAKCREADLKLFFPERGASTRAAKAICAACPVREACLAWGLEERFGIWGGLSERERRRIRRQRLAAETARRIEANRPAS